MRQISGYTVTVDACDAHLLDAYNWHVITGRYIAAHNRRHYKQQKNVLLHRLIANPPAGMEVDHRDRNPLNNTRGNLRICTRSQNGVNRPKYGTCTSRFKGVYLVRSTGRWSAKVSYQGRLHHLGTFDTEVEAAKAYDQKMVSLYGEFARLNFP